MSNNVEALPEIDLSLASLRQAIKKESRAYGGSFHRRSGLRAVVVTMVGVRWPLLGGASG